MKRARIIHGIVWAVITLAVITTVVIAWHAQGCGMKSLLLATAMYSAMGVGLWGCGDRSIRDLRLPNPLKEGARRE